MKWGQRIDAYANIAILSIDSKESVRELTVVLMDGLAFLVFVCFRHIRWFLEFSCLICAAKIWNNSLKKQAYNVDT